MNAHPRHPGTEELADFQSGMTDAARGDQLAAHIAECPECASVAERLSQVSALLASIPPPAMPDGIEDRIMGALAAEAARRDSAGVDSVALAASASAATDSPSPAPASTMTSPIGPSASMPPSDSPTPASRVPLSVGAFSLVAARRRTSRRQGMTAPIGVLVAAAACLMLAFVGYRLSGPGHSATPPVAGGNAGPLHSAGAAPGSGPPGAHLHTVDPTAGPSMGPASTTPFFVLVSPTNFRKATLQEQVSQQMAMSHATPQPSLRPPSTQLIGCVKHLIGSAKPALVEEASYQSRPAYVIAMPYRVWVVALNATAANPEVRVSVPLPPGR
jgi:hypothetical protein